ncbi:TetR/AcrR family transcriptional regulator [Cohnella algarum]|uniref:TetR/AcrR family transcriptional regulator n=1 Tax=Cohnella algarum TaxID=2044859 RepID=UPI001F07B497|nr:helix-turn-helix domain-containing protein [Cohnella algarum]
MPDYDEAGTGRSAPRGRPRSREVHERILDAAIASLAETGVEKLSIEAVAQRAGVGKTSIYRRWSRKEDLVADALERLKPRSERRRGANCAKICSSWRTASLRA